MSHPTRVRGLKFYRFFDAKKLRAVAPYTGAWIEINEFYFKEHTYNVAPYTGAWIEIFVHLYPS